MTVDWSLPITIARMSGEVRIKDPPGKIEEFSGMLEDT